MLTPAFIQLPFCVGAGALARVGAVGALTGLVGVPKVPYGAFGKMTSDALMLAVGSLGVPIWSELVILAFRIHDKLMEIARNTMAAR